MESQKPFSLSAFSSNLKDFYSFKDLGRIWELSNLETVVVRLAEKKKRKNHMALLCLFCISAQNWLWLQFISYRRWGKIKDDVDSGSINSSPGTSAAECTNRSSLRVTRNIFPSPKSFSQCNSNTHIQLVRISEFPAINLPLDVCILWWRSWKGKNIAAAKKKWQLNREMHEWKHVTRGGDPVSKYQAITAKLYEGMLWLCFGTGGLLSTEHLLWSKKITASLGLPCT